MSAKTEDAELENVLQQIFMECDASVSTSSPDSTGDAVPLSRIIEYVQDQLPSWSIDDLVELWKCLVAVSTNDRVNLDQFKEATKCWIVKVQQSTQDSNNNAREKLYLVSDADSSMKTMDINKDIVEMELREKFRELYQENIGLHDELERHEESINNLKQQHSITENKLKHYIQKCQQLETENDEQKDQLNELIKKEKTMALALQRYTKEHQNLLKQLEAAEIEILTIPSLKDKLEKITKEKMDCMKLITKMEEDFQEKENNCNLLRTTIVQLEDINTSIKESYEYKIRNLREENRVLKDQSVDNMELSVLSWRSLPQETLSPILSTDECYTMHSTPYKSKNELMQDSLYTELKALGFTPECNRNDRQDLEEELNKYDIAICVILEQLEKVIQFFVTIRGSTDDLSHFNSQDTDARAHNINVLKHKATLLLYMVTEEITRRNTRRDSSTQLQADPANATSNLDQFGVRNFRDLLLTHVRSKTETGLRSIVSHCVNNEDNDSFSKILKTYTGVQNRFRIIEPIIEELQDIIESTLGALGENCSVSGNSRFRSVHTLSSSMQSSSLTAEDSQWRTFGYPATNTADAPFARGGSLTHEDGEEESVSLVAETRDVSDQEDPARFEENQLSKTPDVTNVPQTDLKDEEWTSARSFQVPEVSSASTPTNPRRKISVYCRSFDVVAVEDQREDHPGSSLEVRQSPSNPDDSPTQVDRIATRDRNSSPNAKYSFNHVYRSVKSDSDSSNSSPRKFQDSLLDDELPVEQPILRKVRLAPTRLRFLQGTKNDFDETAEASNRASPVLLNSTELDISDSPLSPIGEHKEDDDSSVYSSSTFTDKCKMEVKSVIPDSKSCLNKNVSQMNSMPNHRLFPCNQADSAILVNSEDPHSQASVRRVDSESQPRIERSVDSQMSSREDSLAVSGSEHKPAVGSGDRCGIEKVANGIGKTINVVSSTSTLADPVSMRVMPCKNVTQSDGKILQRILSKTKQELLVNTRRSYSEGENLGRLECRCRLKNGSSIPESNLRRVFPSLTEIRLQESGIANLSDFEECKDNLSELELQKKYTAFSLCLSIDRLTLSRRIAMSCRQRDQSERNLSCEVRKMQQDIQDLAPLCTDRESVERVERVRHQLDMIVRCAHRVSCAAETLGAVHQERRVSRAVLLADKYLQVLQSRCEKLFSNVTETKRILVENNIVIEENSSELNDELPRIRYRSGTPANNRMMMARRRASVATMSRPMNAQEVIKEAVKQRNSVSGRMTLRRPSFSAESPKWEMEKLDRTESSNSISELRGIFEQAESRRSSREENNNMLRPGHSNSQSTINCMIIDNEVWTNVKEETSPELSDNESINSDSKSSTRSSHTCQIRRRRTSCLSICMMSTLIFGVVFYAILAMSTVNTCHEPFNKRLIRCVFDKYRQIRNTVPHPM